VHEVDEVTQVASEPVQLPGDQGVILAQRFQARFQPGPVVALTRGLVLVESVSGNAGIEGFGAQIRLWTCGGSWVPFQAIRCDIGMLRRVIRFSTEQATLASVFWAGRVRARRLLPMAALYRNIAVSACDRRP